MSDHPVVLAAGGTGGHLYPALAVYNALQEHNLPARLFTDERGLAFAKDFDVQDIDVVPSGGLVSGDPLKRATSLLKLARGWLVSRKLLQKYGAAGVIGFGGYASAPPILAASQLGIPSMLKQGDAILGRANAFVAGRVSKICLGFPNTGGVSKTVLNKVAVVGVPLRQEIEALHASPYSGPRRRISILCLGGSLGAKAFNTLVPKAISNLNQDQRSQIRLVQQVTSNQDRETLATTYREMRIDAKLLHYIDDMAGELSQSDLVIARSGSTTVHEISAIGRAAIFIPAGIHADGQQRHNAQYLQEAGAAWIVEQNESAPSGLNEILRNVLEKPQQLAHKAALAKEKAILGAAHTIVGYAKSEFKLA